MPEYSHPDHKYIEALRNNDSLLIEEIYQKWYKEVIQYVTKNNGSVQDADDLFQEALMAIVKKVRKEDFKLKVPFGGYFYFIYKNKWIDKLRKNKKIRVINEDNERYKHEVDSKVIANDTNQSDERYQLYLLCFEQLSESCQKVLRLSLQGISAKEIMPQLGFATVNSTNQRIHRCRGNLQKLIKDHPAYKNLTNP